ncbi:CGNR zinc finger domain-containing protein [Oxalicibacterium faecigallinarum]|nr:ABATE domain-containing protein [Oxalicibacterium faecigallinarum]
MDSSGHNSSALFVGDNLALDFINTAYGVGDNKQDLLTDDASVTKWLQQAQVASRRSDQAKSRGLLKAALELRDIARELVTMRHAGKWADPSALNRYLSLGSYHLVLRWSKGDEPAVTNQEAASDNVEADLLPVAEALAQLLAEANFEKVRKCECDECTLLFYDRTKAGRRRWCSMAMCGNRMKVAAYRARSKA